MINKFVKKLRLLGYENYNDYLLSEHWKDVKKRYYKSRLKKNCYICGSYSSLNLHHRTYKRLGKEYLQDLIVLCKYCHNKTHELLCKTQNTRINIYNTHKRLKRMT